MSFSLKLIAPVTDENYKLLEANEDYTYHRSSVDQIGSPDADGVSLKCHFDAICRCDNHSTDPFATNVGTTTIERAWSSRPNAAAAWGLPFFTMKTKIVMTYVWGPIDGDVQQLTTTMDLYDANDVLTFSGTPKPTTVPLSQVQVLANSLAGMTLLVQMALNGLRS